MEDIKIGNILIGKEHKPFIIAEMSGNHNQSLERALELVDAAAAAGVAALKLQTYTAGTITMNNWFKIEEKDSLWYGKTLYELYQEAYTPWERHEKIMKRAKEKWILCFSTPFDETAVDFLESLSVPAYKIASFENNYFWLLKKIAKTGKPVIMSTWMTNISDIDKAVRVLRENGCKELILLKCTSTYPASPENTNIATIPHMAETFKCHVWLSDHTMWIWVSVASVALWARVIEKHFTLKRSDGGPDSAFSLEPEELKALVIESERAFKSIWEITYEIDDSEKNCLKHKRSIYVSANIKKWEKFSKDNIRVIRPWNWIPPEFYDLLIWKTVHGDIEKWKPLNWDNIF